MNRAPEEIEELFEANEKLVYATVNRNYRNPAFRDAHGLDMDDVLQLGRMGLFRACKNYDKSRGSSFQNHAIRNIIWSINKESTRYSLGNMNVSSNELADRTSMDATISQAEENGVTLHDVLEDKNEDFAMGEIEELIEEIEETISKPVANIVRMRLNGATYDEIGKEIGVSRQAVEQNLSKHKDSILKLYQGA